MTRSIVPILSAVLVAALAACGGSSNPNPGVGCDENRIECDAVCVDTSADPLHCGGCGTACTTGEVCVDGGCIAWDCREEPCPGLAFCDLSTGTCLAGCAFSDQCGPNEECALATHECDCTTDAHRCSGACSPDSSVATCGDRCDPCPDDPNGDAICSAGACSFACDPGTKLCGGRCAECPGGSSFGCDGDQCVPNTCGAGALLCDGACATCPVGDDFGCDGAQCVATSCPAGFELCDGSCASCPAAAETACDGAACVAVACPTGQVVCATGCCPWQFEDVSPGPGTGIELALGTGGARWVSYIQAGGGQGLVVAHKAGATWVREDVLSEAVAYGDTSIDLDAAGSPHVAWRLGSNYVVRVSTRSTAGAWTSTNLASNTGEGLALEVDAGDGAQIIYEGSDGLRRAYGPPWGSELVPTPFLEIEENPALAIDGSGAFHVGYYVATTGDLGYSRRVGTSWNLQVTKPATGTIGSEVAIAATTATGARIAYREDGDLYLARWTGSAWEDEVVSTTPTSSGHLALALDAHGAAHLAFLDTMQRLVYVHWTGTAWDERVVAPSSVGASATFDLELDAAGHPVLVYLAAGGIRLAH